MSAAVNAVRFANEALARAAVAKIDAALGYPRCDCPSHGDGVDGAGRHPGCLCASATTTAPLCPYVTATYTNVVVDQRTGAAYVVADAVTAMLLRLPVAPVDIRAAQATNARVPVRKSL